jgi:predicted adenylyl cyclase CyaB
VPAGRLPLFRAIMPTNIEIKARTSDLETIADRALSAGGRDERVLMQEDVFFRVEDGKLKLRMFGDGSAELICYRRANGSEARPSDYTIAPTSDPSALRSILGDVLGETGVVRKRRQLIMIGQTRVHLDEVENLGSFVELEVVLREGQSEADGRAIANDLVSRLGITGADLLSDSYVDLLHASTEPRP